jgi:serine/threonine-protein kinase
MSAQPSNAYPTAGEIIDGKYQIERMLGEGGMGAVAKAIHLLLRAPVALKFMNPQYVSFPGAVERFLNEGVASKAIKSEHVVQVSDVGKLPSGAPYLVMDCLEGHDLSDVLKDQGKPGLQIDRVIHFMAQILRGLQVAHALGIIHRDMKPSNCFVVRHEGQPDFVKILDFGISKVAQPGSASLTQTNSALGTPLYMSPEQARSPRDVDTRSDIYSVGVIFYELLTGNPPFTSESGEFTEILFKLFTADIPPIQDARPEISSELAAVVHKSLARDVADRYQTVAEFAEALTPFASPRTLPVLDRIKQYQPEGRSSIMPRPENGPSSTFAFSALGQHAGSDLNRGHVTATPAATDTRATPSEATARTQISYPELEQHLPAATQLMAQQARPGSQPGAQAAAAQGQTPEAREQPEVRTNLAVVRDTTDPGMPGAANTSRRSPLIFALPVVAVLGIVGAIVAFRARGEAKADNGSNVSSTSNGVGLVATGAPLPSVGMVLPGPSGTNTTADPTASPKDAGIAVKPTNPGPSGSGKNAGVPGAATGTGTMPTAKPTGTSTARPHVLDNEAVN